MEADKMKTVSKEKIVYVFKPDMKPVKRISPPEIINFKAHDALKGQIDSEEKLLEEIDFSQVNPATGPVYIKGAEKGDILKVKILDMTLPEEGVTVIAPEEGVLGDLVEEARTRISRIKDDYVYFNDFKIPIRPNVGVIGVASAEETYPTGTPWKHGGNMDTTDITPGSTVYLPVQQEGGLLALGDCHAVMGDGEVCVSGCEIASEVLTKVDVIKEASLEWPMVETKEQIMIITSGESPKAAIREATKQAVETLARGNNLDWNDAYILASLVVDLKISQMVDPTKTVRATIPKRILSIREALKTFEES